MSVDQWSAGEAEGVRRSLTSDIWTLLAVLGGLLVAIGLWLTGTTIGIALLPVAYAAAVGLVPPVGITVCILILGIASPSATLPLLIAGCGLFALAMSGLDGTPNPLLAVAILAVMTAIPVVVAGLAWNTWPPWLATTAVLVVIATVGYVTHRYERVMLGLVTDVDDSEAEP